MLPNAYADLAREGAPKMLVEALKLFGTIEMPGLGSNPVIMSWSDELGLKASYSSDSVPWCGLFMAVVAKRAGKTPPIAPLWALNWALFGAATPAPMLGDVLVFKRPSGGHVALYVGEDDQAFHVLGGNQSDQVCITRIERDRLHAARRPIYSVGQPANVRRIIRSPAGEISTNEA